jgi:DME family drug/metabolite transporter
MAVSGIATLSGFAYDGVAAGWGLAVLAGVCYPVYGHVAQDLMSDRSAIEAIAAVFGAGAVLALPLAVPSTSRVTDDGAALLLVLYLGLVATALAYALWAFGLRTLPLRDTVTLTLVEPVAAAVLAAVVLEEPLTVLSWTAITAILGGVLLATSRAVERHAATSSGNRPVPPV